jgi:uncharacterized membrane protein YdjX (TVP38/TMEM64 family)
VLFFAGMAILPAFGFPLLPFTLAAGPAFAGRMGVPAVVLCAVAAVTVNVALSHWLAARALRPLVLRAVTRLGYRLPVLPHGTDWQTVFIVRLTPGPPFFVQSYLLGLIRTAWIPYMIVSVAVPSLYIVGVIVAGDALWSGQMKPALLAFGALGVVACGLKLWRTRRLHRTAVAPADPNPSRL